MSDALKKDAVDSAIEGLEEVTDDISDVRVYDFPVLLIFLALFLIVALQFFTRYVLNDSLGWIEDELALIREADAAGIPMMGICFGGQLISKALGGEVTRGEGMEIGWYPIYRLDDAKSDEWLDGLPVEFEAFHWHADTFSMPPGSRPLLMSECYTNQGYVLRDHLGMQFHLEMTHEMVESWIAKYGSDLKLDSCCAQSAEAMREDLAGRIDRLHEISDLLYGNWLKRVRRREGVD